MQALAQSVIAGKTVYLQGAKISPAQVTSFVDQTPLDEASRNLTAFMAMGGLYQWTRVALGPKGSGPYFQRSMSNTVLAGLVYQICELYIDDVLIHGRDLETFLHNVRKVFERLREFNVAVNPAKTKLGLAEVEYVGHVISATGISFTEEKRLKVLKFPLPETQKNLLQFIGLANYFRDHVPNMTEMVQPLRKLIPLKKYKLLSSASRQSPTVRSFIFWRILRLLFYKQMPQTMVSAAIYSW